MHLVRPEETDFDRGVVVDPRIPLPMRAALETGDGVSTYKLKSALTLRVSEVRQILLRPADAAGADFAIESVRLVSRREHLAGTASGVGWHGLSGVYRETLVSRAPEAIRFSQAGIVETQVLPLWSMPINFLLLVLLKAGEWLLRLYWGRL